MDAARRFLPLFLPPFSLIRGAGFLLSALRHSTATLPCRSMPLEHIYLRE
jgi:hypothetical protein